MAMSSKNGGPQYVRASLISVVLTAVAITVNHTYTLGTGALVLGAALVVVPAILLMSFRKTESKAALIGYLLINAWIVVGFGLMNGLWDTTFRLFLGTLLSSFSTAFPKPVIGTFAFEISGILTFIGSCFVLYYGVRLLLASEVWRARRSTFSSRGQAWMTTAAALGLAVAVSGYVWADRDVWTAPSNGIVKIGVIVPTDGPYAILGNSFVKALKIEAARVGLVVTNEQTFAESVRDFTAIIAQAEVSKPDVYYVEALNPGLDLLAQQLTDAEIHNVASVVAPSLSDKTELFEGMWYTDSNLREMAFKQRFEEKYPGTRFATHMMPYAYDNLNMIVQAFERGQNPAVYLRNIRIYDGTAGTLTKQLGSGNFTSTPAVWVIANGKPTLAANR